MRIVRLSAAVVFGGIALGSLPGGLIPGAAWAQTNPKADDLVRSLTPTSTLGPSRGVRIAPTTPSGPGGTTATTTTSGPTGQPVGTTTAALPSASLNVLFATGSAQLTPAAIQTLSELGKALTDPRIANSKFRIEGHTDTVGSPTSNKALSDARAKAVASYLASTYHVDPSKLEAVGVGEEGLLVQTPAQTPEARNRRVVVVNLGG